MKSLFLIILSFLISTPTWAELPEILFDSEHSIALDGLIEEGSILIDRNSESYAESRIREQLKYSVGQLNGINGVADLNRIEISVTEINPIDENQFLVRYSAELFIAWPRSRSIPDEFVLILPESTSYQGQQDFFNTYSKPECHSPQAHDVSLGGFWYYYRPNSYLCPLSTDPNPLYAVLISTQLSISDENTEGKSPEYHKVWEDGQLIITSVFGKNEAESHSNYDAGVQSFQKMYSDLLNYYGSPARSSLEPGQVVGIDTPEIELMFNSISGPVIVHLLLVNHIRYPSSDFRQLYNELTKNSDFISYAGHSGLGANIRALARMGEFMPGQYQIFLVNGCDTFAYVDHSLRDAHHRVNPEVGPYKFFDLITNAMPAFFHSNARSVMSVVKGLTEQRFTYREILGQFDSYQKAVVIGEEDND